MRFTGKFYIYFHHFCLPFYMDGLHYYRRVFPNLFFCFSCVCVCVCRNITVSAVQWTRKFKLVYKCISISMCCYPSSYLHSSPLLSTSSFQHVVDECSSPFSAQVPDEMFCQVSPLVLVLLRPSSFVCKAISFYQLLSPSTFYGRGFLFTYFWWPCNPLGGFGFPNKAFPFLSMMV